MADVPMPSGRDGWLFLAFCRGADLEGTTRTQEELVEQFWLWKEVVVNGNDEAAEEANRG